MVIPVPQTPPAPQLSSSKPFSLKRMPLIIGIIVVVIILVVVGSIVILKSGKVPQIPPINKSKVSGSLPVNPNSSSVTSAVVVYSFSGQVDSFSSNSIVLKSTTDKLPALKVTDKTPVFKIGSDKKPQKASLTDIKNGSKVSISAVYSLTNSSWQVSRITLQP